MKTPVKQRVLTRLTTYLGKKLCRNTILVYILNFTWGVLANAIGALVALILLPFSYGIEWYYRCPFLRFQKKAGKYVYGFSLGLFSFISSNMDQRLMDHEYGHTVQNAIFGPFMIFLVLIPSIIRFWYRNHINKKGGTLKTEYYDIWFEYSASAIGEYIVYGD